MAQEIVTWCDRHLNMNEDDEGVRVPGTTRRLTIGKAKPIEYETDLCEPCYKELFGPLLDFISTTGAQPVSGGEKKTPNKEREVHLICPLCKAQGVEYVARRRGAMRTHMETAHDTTLAEVETQLGQTIDGKPLPFECSVCGSRFSHAQARGAHERHRHGIEGQNVHANRAATPTT